MKLFVALSTVVRLIAQDDRGMIAGVGAMGRTTVSQCCKSTLHVILVDNGEAKLDQLQINK